MEIDQETWKWFQWLGFENSILMNQDDSNLDYVLSIPFSDMIIRGPAFKDILQKIAINKSVSITESQKLLDIVDAENDTDIDNNTDIIIDFLSYLDLDLGEEIRQLMVEQDIDTYRDLIIDLSKALGPGTDPELTNLDINGQHQMNSNVFDRDRGEQGLNFDESTDPQPPKRKPVNKANLEKIDLMNINEDKNLLQCSSIPEILVITISRSFKISTIEVKIHPKNFNKNSKK